MIYLNVQINDAKFVKLVNALFSHIPVIKWEIRSKITFSTVNVLYYLKCNMCKLEA